MKTYVITGGTGKTGKRISQKLLANANTVRIVCRDEKKAASLKEKGAEIFAGDNLDEPFLKSAFRGADAVYVVLPIDIKAADYTATQVAHATAIRNATVEAGIKYAVTLSSVGANLDKGNGVVLGLHKMEELFNQVPDLNVRHVRATYFMENTLGQIPSIKEHGILSVPIDGKIKFPLVAAKDISETAFRLLSTLRFTGKSVDYVLGQRDISFDEIAAIYGRVLGKPDVKYIQMPDEKFRSVMSGVGMSNSAIEKFLEFNHLINNGTIHSLYKRTDENTTPTSFEEFAENHVPKSAV